jgi:hypothetical protein
MNRLDTIYIGYDKREQAYFDVLVESIKRNTTETYNIVPLYEDKLRMMGLYWRGFSVKEAENYDLQKFDYLDEKPFSTDFSFTRFLIPIERMIIFLKKLRKWIIKYNKLIPKRIGQALCCGIVIM